MAVWLLPFQVCAAWRVGIINTNHDVSNFLCEKNFPSPFFFSGINRKKSHHRKKERKKERWASWQPQNAFAQTPRHLQVVPCSFACSQSDLLLQSSGQVSTSLRNKQTRKIKHQHTCISSPFSVIHWPYLYNYRTLDKVSFLYTGRSIGYFVGSRKH